MTLTAAPARPITERSGVELAAAIRAGEVSSREVVEAHIAVLERAQPRTRAVAADRYAGAREDADAVDARLAATAGDTDAVLPPLLGVPCTIKESIALAGMPNCAGLVSRRDLRSEVSAPTVQRLLDAGAIPLAVTNTSELCMWIEADNRVYGRTRNAYDPARIAGGSSGGEGAAVGSGGTPFGLGSDIGGSIRLPAFFNGVFGHKASPGLLPNTGQFPEAHGEGANALLTTGPITRRAEDLMPLLRILAGPDGVDPFAREAQLGEPDDVDLAALDVIVTEDAAFIHPRREMRDARERAAGALADAGATVRHESLRSLRRAFEFYIATLQTGSGPDGIRGLLSPDAPIRLRSLVRDALRGRGDHTLATLLLVASERVGNRLPQGPARKAVAAGRALGRELEGVVGNGVILHPPFSRPAPRHGRTVGRPWVIHHVAIFNLLGLPVTQVPLGLGVKGLPLGVQVAARRDADHVTIAVARELERRVGGWVPPRG